jgi:hypothetical protein
MSFLFYSSHITGTPSDSAWTEIYEYVPTDKSVLSEKGRLLIIVQANSDSNIQQFLIKNVFSKIEKMYYEFEGNPVDALKNALIEVDPKEGCEICIASLTEDTLTGVTFGASLIVLLRNNIYVTLLRGKEAEIKSLSGHIRTGDTIIFGTKRFFEIANESILRTTAQTHSPESIAKFLEPMINVQEQEGSGAYFIKLQEEDAPRVPVPSPPPHSFLGGKPLYVRSEVPFQEKRKTPVAIGVILVICLIASIIWGANKKEEKAKEEAFQNQVSSIQSKLDESVSLAHINPQVARELFLEAQSEVSNLSSETHPEKIEELKGKVKDLQKEVLGESPVDLSLFVDLSLLSEGFVAKSVSVDGANVYILDSDNKKIAKVSLISKRAEIVAGPTLVDEGYEIASYADNLYILSKDDVLELTSQKRVIEDGWSNALIYSYAGNIYVLDKESSEIYRYTRGESGFSEKSRWLEEGITADLGNIKQWIIDGSIWTIDETSTILRFTNGTYWEFTPQGVFPELSEITTLYTNDEQENVYILDANSGRIVVLSKQGEFQRQYNSEELKNAENIVVLEEDQKIFAVSKNKMYVMETGGDGGN